MVAVQEIRDQEALPKVRHISNFTVRPRPGRGHINCWSAVFDGHIRGF